MSANTGLIGRAWVRQTRGQSRYRCTLPHGRLIREWFWHGRFDFRRQRQMGQSLGAAFTSVRRSHDYRYWLGIENRLRIGRAFFPGHAAADGISVRGTIRPIRGIVTARKNHAKYPNQHNGFHAFLLQLRLSCRHGPYRSDSFSLVPNYRQKPSINFRQNRKILPNLFYPRRSLIFFAEIYPFC